MIFFFFVFFYVALSVTEVKPVVIVATDIQKKTHTAYYSHNILLLLLIRDIYI